jgi:tripartite-type tricarboxylate transporter receptor subunit TctC
LAPAKTPPAAVAALNQHIGKAVSSSDVKEKLATSGVDTRVTTPEETGTILRNEIAHWGKVVQESGVKMQ